MSQSRKQTPGASQRAIQHHYDVGDAFYQLWLDETLTYSCALWDSADSLEAAQLAKIEHHIAGARAHGARRVLDVGCGWGSALQRLVGVHAVEYAVGLTLSPSQAAAIHRRRCPGVEVRVESWVDHVPPEPYDAAISIGAFEHFARPDVSAAEKIAGYRGFFRRCHGWLKPGGFLSLQTICYLQSGRENFSDFFAMEVFPESDLPRLAEIVTACDRIFEVVTLRDDRPHYERTIMEWRRRLRARRAEAAALVGEVVVERYDRYLQLMIIGFHVGTMGLLRMALRRLDRTG